MFKFWTNIFYYERTNLSVHIFCKTLKQRILQLIFHGFLFYMFRTVEDFAIFFLYFFAITIYLFIKIIFLLLF